MATVAALEKAIATNERYAANYRKAGKNPAKYVAKIAALKVELAAALAPKAATPAAVPPPVVQPADPPEVVFDPSMWPPLAVAAGTGRAGKYGEVFGGAIPADNAYSDLQTSGGTWGGVNIPPMFYLFLRGKIIFAQEGNLDPAERIRLRTEHRPANTTGLV
jgi:hypothetical protein